MKRRGVPLSDAPAKSSSDDLGVQSLAGRRVLIVGTGKEGRAIADAVDGIAASAIAYNDAEGDSVDAWRNTWGQRIPVVVGESPGGIDVVIASPGVSKHHPLLRSMRESGVAVTSGTSLWLAEHAASTIGVTGSKGKSTTSSLINHLTARLVGDVVLGGNIGLPLLAMPPAPRYVVELSSYQCSALTVSPATVVLTSLFPEHLDWHGSEDDYYADKLNIVAHGPRAVILNALDPRLVDQIRRRFEELEYEPVGLPQSFHVADGWFRHGEIALFERSALPLRGDHNATNACLALAALDANGYSILDNAPAVAQALAEFHPLEHRLEEIPDAAGITFVDDSLSTSPYAAIEAMRAFAPAPLTLLVGGQDRGVDYAPLIDYVAEHPICAVIGLPGSGAHLTEMMPEAQPVAVAADMGDAVRKARALTPHGGIVLLSPAAPSYGFYANYAERAADFRHAIETTR
ncbi:UDP-N-acetylmuramoyl-L-alanine--D-glutamate ligase [Salinibacterium hongtaonis]|uniref:UDP-N-acetylmuramoylalanine--D-glutamate ligase n=1 Tax=Homoserinimonas hongtaonis TaxID=2079791 RepID=A0A2U1SX34_9MICO|nr:UDP-N-acetylmuramoyl-L-alanine--D-glutamate ligase [Salinibacterium hongtaonis]